MSDNNSEQDKTEDATPFKLRKARREGQIARGSDLGFFATLVGMCIFGLAAGPGFMTEISNSMARLFAVTSTDASTSAVTLRAISEAYGGVIRYILILGATVAITVIVFEILQIRGPVFTAKPLKPEFNRLNPAKGLKKIVSIRMLKETVKSLVKMGLYVGAAILVIRYSLQGFSNTIQDAGDLVRAMQGAGFTLLIVICVLALGVTAIDQVIARSEFAKQMRMSKRDVKREHKDHEGEPRIKERRRQLHSEYSKQNATMGDLPGSDVLLVNPTHYAVALSYDRDKADAPIVRAKGRNRFAERLKREAAQAGIPIIRKPALARALFRSGVVGSTISSSHFKDVADVYLALARSRAEQGG